MANSHLDAFAATMREFSKANSIPACCCIALNPTYKGIVHFQEFDYIVMLQIKKACDEHMAFEADDLKIVQQKFDHGIFNVFDYTVIGLSEIRIPLEVTS